jgi:chitinase
LTDLAAKVAAGVRIHLSLGGAGGAINIANRSAILSGIANVRSQLGGMLHGIDWDLEGSATLGSADCAAISADLKSAYGSNFAITFAPNGSNQSQYRTAALACQAVGALDMIGQQYYDAVVSLSAAAGNIQVYLNAGIPISRISVGMMIGSSSIYWTNSVARSNMQSLMAQFPGLQKAYLWEAARAGTTEWAADMRSLIGF